MFRVFISCIFILAVLSCQNENQYKDVGDIPKDESLDDPSFSVCSEHRIKQYYVRGSSDSAPSYQGEKRAMDAFIYSKYPSNEYSESGYCTIRFIVNCNGQSGRFRIKETTLKLEPYEFSSDLPEQLLSIVRNLNGWIPRESYGKAIDTYHYLTFKIEEGSLTEILP